MNGYFSFISGVVMSVSWERKSWSLSLTLKMLKRKIRIQKMSRIIYIFCDIVMKTCGGSSPGKVRLINNLMQHSKIEQHARLTNLKSLRVRNHMNLFRLIQHRYSVS